MVIDIEYNPKNSLSIGLTPLFPTIHARNIDIDMRSIQRYISVIQRWKQFSQPQ